MFADFFATVFSQSSAFNIEFPIPTACDQVSNCVIEPADVLNAFKKLNIKKGSNGCF